MPSSSKPGVITLPQARQKLAQRRLDRKWSFDTLYADVVGKIGPDKAPSPPTLRRFVRDETQPDETTLHVIREYLDIVAAEERAA